MGTRGRWGRTRYSRHLTLEHTGAQGVEVDDISRLDSKGRGKWMGWYLFEKLEKVSQKKCFKL
jgi:hypothetical protein